MLFQTPVRSKATAGEATLDFGGGIGDFKAEVVVTGVPGVKADSQVYCEVKIEATANHSVDELLFDPIRVIAKDLVVGTGFTVYGQMDSGKARGVYTINWSVI